ncbi:MAG: N-acetylglucosamine-6-phosphate deacetylase [Solobacterium sp.]|nr:N-acetylglucosamine-6-phosphate deacetylase [Solobacterium sp.]
MRIQSTRVWIGEHFAPAQLEISGGRIWGVDAYDREKCQADFGNCMILPGFIDIHCHGGYGYDSNDAKADGLRKWAAELPKEGVTAFMPTVMTDESGRISKALRSIAETKRRMDKGAAILGIHLEGPYLNPEYAGAQPPEYITSPDIPQFRLWQRTADNLIRIITLAPENDIDYTFTRFCAHNNVLVSIGHSGATYQKVVNAHSNGAVCITHTFNAQSGLHHRENGVAGAALLLDDMYCEIIPDGHHVAPEVLQLFFRCKGNDHAIVVSDSLRGKGAGIGEHFLFAGNPCIIETDGSARVANTGRLAGSTLKINEGLRHLIRECGIDPAAAINACTINPARMLQIDGTTGRIRTGYNADLTVLDDDYQVVQTYCRGLEQL